MLFYCVLCLGLAPLFGAIAASPQVTFMSLLFIKKPFSVFNTMQNRQNEGCQGAIACTPIFGPDKSKTFFIK
jgi:hypothetical protein